MKKIFIIMILLLSGCSVKENIHTKINENQSMELTIISAFDDEFLNGAMNEINKTDDKKYTEKEMYKKLVGNGGLNAYLHTNDMRDVNRMAFEEGNEEAKNVFDAFIYQICKDIGAMATVLKGKVDQIVLTGGIAYGKEVCDAIKDRVSFIANITVYPGEDELLALAQGALRVLDGTEKAMEY